ncbi:MAG: hypothetical protein J6X49_10050 [Victivallales bacterium]|nr:hypothetical protein [Victivallales bacterium]
MSRLREDGPLGIPPLGKMQAQAGRTHHLPGTGGTQAIPLPSPPPP